MAEFLDIVDEKDNVIGKDTRKNIYNKGLDKQIRVSYLLIFNPRGELHVPVRSMNKKQYPGFYDFSVGEHVMSGETYDEAIYRGLEEELGIKDKEVTFLGKLIPQKHGSQCFSHVYQMLYGPKIENSVLDQELPTMQKLDPPENLYQFYQFHQA